MNNNKVENSAVSITEILYQLLLMAIAAGLLIGSWLLLDWLNKAETLPFNKVELVNKLENQASKELQSVTEEALNGGFFSINIDELRMSLLVELPWVKSVSVRKIWPDRLQVKIVEHKPAARWLSAEKNKQADKKIQFLSQEGTVFSPLLSSAQEHKFAGMILLTGSKSNTEKILAACVQIDKELQQLGLAMEQCGMNTRRSWELKTFLRSAGNSIDIKLGKEKIMQHLKGFTQVFSNQLERYLIAVEAVDLRYENGFSIKWKPYDGLFQNTLLNKNDILIESEQREKTGI